MVSVIFKGAKSQRLMHAFCIKQHFAAWIDKMYGSLAIAQCPGKK